ncbi:MAG TPA: CHAT domain-containing protein [Candidatus Acidoferrales bacterium]|nr:CHAT domain-containing protein [Candidatus Acidoferrales bacterium]
MKRIEAGEDVEPENYLEIAVTKWLPGWWGDPTRERALRWLGTRFEERHGDRWLSDVLAVRRSEKMSEGLSALAEAVQANGADEPDRAMERAAPAAEQLRAAGSEAAASRADLEGAYARHRNIASAAECLAMAVKLEQRAQTMKYWWILGQAVLEQGNCRSLLGESGAAHRDMARALDVVRTAGYRDLELRASGILANAQTFDGNLAEAWKMGRAALTKYWVAPFSGVRAQQIYYNLALSGEGLGLHQTSFVLQREAARAIAETPRKRIEAGTRAVLGDLAMGAGRSQDATMEFDRAARVFDQLRGPSDSDFRSRAEFYRAQAEAAAGSPEVALRRLNAARTSVEKAGAVMDRIRFQELLGDLLRRAGKPIEAESAYRQAIDLVDLRLRTRPGTRERAQILLSAGKAYRGLVEISWERGDQVEALRLWEWFRAGERDGPRREPDFDRRRAQIRHESFLSYVLFPGGVMVWLFDERGVEGRRLSVTPDELETVALRFLRECADAGSDLASMRRDARQLYDWLLAPLAERLDPARVLVIEPDGPVGAIPVQALMDENFRYVGERFGISIGSGLADYQQRETAGPVTAGAKTLVVASPVLSEEATKTFPPLPGTMLEGQSIQKLFRNSVLLTGREATLDAVERFRPGTELFHFSGHGFSNGGNGGLLLSPDSNDSGGAGVLDSSTMASQDWTRCRLAVLSACSTGTGEAGASVNPESLVRGFLWAGVARVVVSRWNLDTATGTRFMDQFYTNLLSGTDVAVALQGAAKRVRENGATSHPYYWAGFQSFGAR